MADEVDGNRIAKSLCFLFSCMYLFSLLPYVNFLPPDNLVSGAHSQKPNELQHLDPETIRSPNVRQLCHQNPTQRVGQYLFLRLPIPACAPVPDQPSHVQVGR